MPDPTIALTVGSTLLSGAMQADAASEAAGIQGAASQAGIDEQRRQFNEIQRLLQPYVGAGTTAIKGLSPYAQAGAPALQQQMALAGLGGAQAQQAAIDQIAQSPLLQAQMKQGEEAMLQRASATGGLRGGNLQAALAQFRPQMLQQAITDQYGRLGGLTALGQQTTQNLAQLGQASAARVGATGMESAGNIANLLGQQGAAQAGATMAGVAPFANLLNMPMQLAGMSAVTGRNPFGSLFGGSTPLPPMGPGVFTTG